MGRTVLQLLADVDDAMRRSAHPREDGPSVTKEVDTPAITPLLDEIRDELHALAADRLSALAPFAMAMVKRVPRTSFEGPVRRMSWQTVEVPGRVAAHLVIEADSPRFRIEPDKEGDGWDWDGVGEFVEFVVYTVDGDVLYRDSPGGGNPRKGAHMDPRLVIN